MNAPDGFYCIRCERVYPTDGTFRGYFERASEHLLSAHGEMIGVQRGSAS